MNMVVMRGEYPVSLCVSEGSELTGRIHGKDEWMGIFNNEKKINITIAR